MVRIKICGITNLKDAQLAVNYGAWALGFIFYRKSPRYILPAKAKEIIEKLPPFVTTVGIFVNEDVKIIEKVCRTTKIQTVQLHGNESPQFCRRLKGFKIIKAFRVGRDLSIRHVNSYDVSAVLFDTFQTDSYGGTGKVFNWGLIKKNKIGKPVILSGGINPSNIKKAVNLLKPYAVDASSGVETSPGIKNPARMKRLFAQVA